MRFRIIYIYPQTGSKRHRRHRYIGPFIVPVRSSWEAAQRVKINIHTQE